MRASLPQEVRAYLLEHGPSIASDVASGICARRSDVDVVLAGEGFRRAAKPLGKSNPRAVYFDVSRRVLPRLAGPSRAERVLAVLRDGRKHTRAEIFDAAGGFFLTNNAASELRADGYDVRHGREGLLDVYWLAPSIESEEAA